METSPIETIAIKCPICKSDDHSRLLSTEDFVYRVPGYYQFVSCKQCRHIFISPRPDDKSLMRCYPSSYAPYHALDALADPLLDSKRQQGTERKRLSSLRAILKRLPGLRASLFWLGLDYASFLPQPPQPGESRMLEIGCADGQFLDRAVQMGWIVDGIEPSCEAALKCTKRGLNVQNAAFSEAVVQPASREAVVFWMVLEHVSDPLELLTMAKHVLVPGGVLAFSIPNGGGFERKVFGKYWLGYDAPRHLQVFSSTSISNILKELGFEQIQITHQANVRYWWGSVAAWGMHRFPKTSWPHRWMQYFIYDPPKIWNVWTLAAGKIISFLRCSGRITIVAYKSSKE